MDWGCWGLYQGHIVSKVKFIVDVYPIFVEIETMREVGLS